MNPSPLPHLLVNLPPGFFDAPRLAPVWERLKPSAAVHFASCNTEAEIAPLLSQADAVLMWSWPRLSPQLLSQCARLRMAACLDLTQTGAKAFLEAGVAVSISRRGFSPAVAEMALLLILECLRRTPTYHTQMQSGTEAWVKNFPGDLPHEERELSGLRVGLVGLGGVGQKLASLLGPFVCDLAAHDPFLPPHVAARLNVALVDMDTLCRRSDVLVLCASTNDGSRHLLTRERIGMLPQNAVVVNVARAALVDTNALVARLQKGDLFAAVDVFDQEPLPPDSPLRSLSNLYLTPHRAGGIWPSVERIVGYLADDLEAFWANRERTHVLTPAMLPSLDG